MDVVILFPGQGSQTPGMGRDLAEHFPAARAAFEAVDAALGVALSRIAFDGPEAELTRTHNAQPALLAHGAAAWAALRDRLAPHVRAAAGHSLGEFTAYHAAGALSLADAARVVRRRGELMYQAGLDRPGTMAAVLGDTAEPLDAICERATAEAGVVVPANYNAPGQVVISGEATGVERASALAKAAGAKRAVALNVSGAFHSPLMQPAAEGLAAVLQATPMQDTTFPVVGNVDAAPNRDAGAARDRLVRQLTSPVRWTDVVLALAARHPAALYVELGPGTVLRGLVRKIAPALDVVSCGTAADVNALLERLA
ncbi:MAG: Malonyl CoA-acyl carrier protein transacylase [uncultured Gemmatimonadaceae bacterium]|uniref:Malonyl CoA-acyl carrier protein transacylase n=1 Tax=uncultured Gemmatimonadaceae bacterium TaxID=246130 RepID=A0A6J4KQT1_9BACT|nr:MAG: Malonyl CoA-acyl carrier protein transacylase [uncultured Gemmatimonadaceae bacterium]